MKVKQQGDYLNPEYAPTCYACGKQVDRVVEIPDTEGVNEPEYCLDCLRAAVQMLEGQQGQSEEQAKTSIVSFDVPNGLTWNFQETKTIQEVSFVSETSDSVYYNPSTGTFCHRCAWCTDFITDDDPGKMEGKERVHQRECRTRYSVSFDLGV